MTRSAILVSFDQRIWHALGEDSCRALMAWRDYAEYAYGAPSESDKDGALVAIDALLGMGLPIEHCDILNTWKMMLETKHAA